MVISTQNLCSKKKDALKIVRTITDIIGEKVAQKQIYQRRFASDSSPNLVMGNKLGWCNQFFGLLN